jgi:ribosomal subunit interface protein
MRYFFSAQSLSKPTFETLQEYSELRFKKIEKFLKGFRESELNLKIHVRKEANEFYIVVEIYISSIKKDLVVRERDVDLRRSIDKASSNLANELIKYKKKRTTIIRNRRNEGKASQNLATE